MISTLTSTAVMTIYMKKRKIKSVKEEGGKERKAEKQKDQNVKRK